MKLGSLARSCNSRLVSLMWFLVVLIGSTLQTINNELEKAIAISLSSMDTGESRGCFILVLELMSNTRGLPVYLVTALARNIENFLNVTISTATSCDFETFLERDITKVLVGFVASCWNSRCAITNIHPLVLLAHSTAILMTVNSAAQKLTCVSDIYMAQHTASITSLKGLQESQSPV